MSLLRRKVASLADANLTTPASLPLGSHTPKRTHVQRHRHHGDGFTFTQLVFDEQLTPVAGQSTDNFTVQGFTGAHVAVTPTGNESDAADTDKEFSITAVGGSFDEVNIDSLTGFDELKHIEIAGLAPIVVGAPEPATIALLGCGRAGLGLIGLRRRQQ